MLWNVLKYFQDAFHVFLHQSWEEKTKDGDACLVKDEDAIQKVKIPDVRNYFDREGGAENCHNPFVNVLLWLDLLHLEMFTKVR